MHTCTLLEVDSHCDFSVLSVMGFPKKNVWVGTRWGELYEVFFGIFDIFNFAKPLTKI